MPINKSLEPLDEQELRMIAKSAKAGIACEPALTKRLLNDLERAKKTAEIYYDGLGPADGDFRYDALRECYNNAVLIKLGELDPEEEEEDDSE